MIENLSFVVIAKNEEFAIKKCLESINKLKLENCEVICVDSGSKDHTLENMMLFKDKISNFSVIKLQGELNASVARNAGLKFASKDYVFYVDGDVELNSLFIEKALYKIRGKEADACTGILHEIVYSENYKSVLKEKYIRKKCRNEQIVRASGGIFIMKNDISNEIGPWDENFFRAQDFEYTLRLSKNYKLISIPFSMGIHHTCLFTNREFGFFWKGHSKFMGNILRDNINNSKNLIELLRRNRGPVTGLFQYFLLIFFIVLNVSFQFYAFNLIILFADIFFGLIKKQSFRNYIIENYLTSLFIFLGFFHKSSKNLNYQVTKVV